MASRNYGLPCTWHYERDQDITVRWGRPDGAFTVHSGDQRGHRHDHSLIDTVSVSRAWNDDTDVARKAREWTQKNPTP